MVKIIANYLPQFHRIPENDKWWGEGFTDWQTVKNAKGIVAGAIQPKVPFDNNYYELDNADVIRWQVEMAKENGIYGFGIYHYWFSSEMCLLDKPVKILLYNKDIDMPFLFIWDNVSWKRSWSAVRFSNDWAPLYENTNNENDGMLAELKYGDEEEWIKHFEYLYSFFQDERYIRHNGKPVFAVFNQDNEPDTLSKMFECWNNEAIKRGMPGIEIWGKTNNRNISIADMNFNYEPHEHGWIAHSIIDKLKNKMDSRKPKIYDYDKIWKKIIKDARKCYDEKLITGAFVNYDDTPRRGIDGKVIINSSYDKFGKYLSELIRIENEKNKEFIFLTAWNEWGEGAYLEPDTYNEYAYLEQIKKCRLYLGE